VYGENWKDNDAYNYLKRFYTTEPTDCFAAIKNKEIICAIFSYSYSYPWQAETLVYV
jgi:hypothetical protein